jgi:hypothetical protein
MNKKNVSGKENKHGLVSRIVYGTCLAAAVTGLCYDSAKPGLRQMLPTAASSRLEDNLTPAEKAFNDFPAEIPRAREIQKYETPGAKYCLVHIRQKHDNPAGLEVPSFYDLTSGKKRLVISGRDYTAEEAIKTIRGIYSNINSTQGDIVQILDYLIKHENLRSIRPEGLTTEDSVSQFVWNDYYRQEFAKLINSGYFTNPEQMKFIPGAFLIFAKDGTLKMLPSEKKWKDNSKPEDSNVREDALLDIVSKSPAAHFEPLQVTVYGAKHDWTDNVESWNKAPKNKENKFSLIVVTPKSQNGDE